MTFQEIHCRRADPSDKDVVASLLQAVGLPLEGVDEHFSDFIVAQVDGELAGCAGLEIHGGHGLLRSVAVMPTRQRRGVGSRLVLAVLADARRRRLKSVILLTETAIDYFQHFGFVMISRGDVPVAVRASAEFQGACPDSAVGMIQWLSPISEAL